MSDSIFLCNVGSGQTQSSDVFGFLRPGLTHPACQTFWQVLFSTDTSHRPSCDRFVFKLYLLAYLLTYLVRQALTMQTRLGSPCLCFTMLGLKEYTTTPHLTCVFAATLHISSPLTVSQHSKGCFGIFIFNQSYSTHTSES